MADLTIIDLGQKVKAKYPGQYDDLSDADVGRKVKAKFPGQYDDFREVATDPTAAIKAAQAAKFPTRAEGGNPNLPWYAGYFGQNKQNPQDLASRTPAQVASDQAANVLTGIPQAVTGIPGTAAAFARMAYHSMTGNHALAGAEAADLLKGATAPGVTPASQAIELAKPGLVNAPTPDAPETAAAAQGSGALLGGILLGEGVKAAKPYVSNAFNAARTRLTAPPTPPDAITAIEQKITGGRSASVATAPHIADIAPELAKDPELVSAKPGEPFRETLFKKLQDAGANVKTEEAAIPDSTPVPKQPILDGLQKLKDVFDRAKATKASDIVSAQMDRLIDAGGGKDTISWGDFSPIKQQLGQDLKEMGVWKRLGTEAQKTTDAALAKTYGQYMKATSDISPELAAANAKYSLLHDATRFAKMDTSTGRYLPEVGQVPITTWDKLKPFVGPMVFGSGTLGGMYSLYRALSQP